MFFKIVVCYQSKLNLNRFLWKHFVLQDMRIVLNVLSNYIYIDCWYKYKIDIKLHKCQSFDMWFIFIFFRYCKISFFTFQKVFILFSPSALLKMKIIKIKIKGHLAIKKQLFFYFNAFNWKFTFFLLLIFLIQMTILHVFH